MVFGWVISKRLFCSLVVDGSEVYSDQWAAKELSLKLSVKVAIKAGGAGLGEVELEGDTLADGETDGDTEDEGLTDGETELLGEPAGMVVTLKLSNCWPDISSPAVITAPIPMPALPAAE